MPLVVVGVASGYTERIFRLFYDEGAMKTDLPGRLYNSILKSLPISLCVIYSLTTVQYVFAADLNPPKWKQLDYITSIMFFSGRSHMEFRHVSPATMKPQFVDPKYGKPLVASPGRVQQLILTSQFLGKVSNISLFFTPGLNSLRRTQLDSGKRQRYKVYQFLDKGVYSLRLNPEPGQEDVSYEVWTDRGEEYFQYPPELDLKQPVIDPTSLFYIVSSGLFKKRGDRAVFTAFVKDKLVTLQLVAEGITELERDYFEQRDKRKIYIDGEKEVLRVSLKPLPFNRSGKALPFEFLGLKKNLEFYIDPENDTPLQFSGKIDIIGTVDIKLNKVVY